MPKNRGVLDAITRSVIDGSDQESSSSFNSDKEYAAVTKGLSSSRVQKKSSLRQMKSKVKELQSLVNHYRENEAALVSSAKLLSGEIIGYEIKMASLHGKMKSILDENNALKETHKSSAEKRIELVRLPSSKEERNYDEYTLLVNLKKEICAKLQDYKNVQNTVNTKLDEIHTFHEKYYEGLELSLDSKVFDAESSKELAKVRRELNNVRKNSEIKVNNLKMQLLQATKSLEHLKKQAKAKDDYLKCIPELVDKANLTMLSYKKSIANQRETIEALQAELSQQSETKGQIETETQNQVQIPTNVTLVDPFEENNPEDLFAIQEQELQDLRLHKKMADERSRTTHLHLERKNNTIKLLQSYVQSLIQRLPPAQRKHHLGIFQKLGSEKSCPLAPAAVTSTYAPLLLLSQHSNHQEIDNTPQRLLLAAPDEQSYSERSTTLNLDYSSRKSYLSRLQPPHIANLKSLTLKTLPRVPTDSPQLPSKDKSQETAKKDDRPKLVANEPVTLDTSTPPVAQSLADSKHCSGRHK